MTEAVDENEEIEGQDVETRTQQLPLVKKIVFALLPLALLLLVGEMVVRLKRGVVFTTTSYREFRLDQARRGYPAVDHPTLGYAPLPDYASTDNYWAKRVTIDGDGLRSNGESSPGTGVAIVAVGDSFTFGDQVHDDETWPAQLERQLGRPVKNGGVFGYSFGQSVLRAEQILEDVRPEWLILAFIERDIGRCEFSRRYSEKPYFDIEGEQLVLRNVPVVRAELSPDARRARRWKDALGQSALLDVILAGTRGPWWYRNEKKVRVHPEGRGVEISKLLVDRAAALCATRSCRLMLVAQGREMGAAATAVMDHARAAGIPALDLVTAFERERKTDRELLRRYFNVHMTPEGNGWVASRIAEALADADRGSEP